MSVLGCKVNYADTRAVVETLDIGLGAPAEIVGTCCVTAAGEKQSRKEVRRALRRVGPGGRVFVTGCAARLAPESFRQLDARVTVVGGGAREASAAIAAALGRSKTDAGPPGQETDGSGRTRFFLKVQDGCANRCAYCVVPLVRGRPRSVPLAALLEEAQRRVAAGYPELVLTGINLGAWRDGSAGLPRLVAALLATPGLGRLRLSSIEATDVTPALIEVLDSSAAAGRHLHLPLQSGDDAVLAAMGRRYTSEEFAQAAALARAALPGLNLTTDVIAGFPGEDESAFRRTLAFIERIGFSKVHVFTYSPRPGTRAAALGDPVPPSEKKRRSRQIAILSDRLGAAHRQRKLGRVSEILFEAVAGPGMLGGYSSDYTRFVAEAQEGTAFAAVLAESVSGEAVEGKIVSADGGTGSRG